MICNSQMQLGSTLSEFTTDEVKNEPMMFNARGDWAWQNGGPITRSFLWTLQLDLRIFDLRDIVFDSRTHMLMNGWYPCIPGFHHDDVPRLRQDGQPWYHDNEIMRMKSLEDFTEAPGLYRSKHACALVGDDICRTEFAIGAEWFSVAELGETLYKQWHPEVVAHLASKRLESVPAPMHQIIYFDDRTWHQGTASRGSGWRWFGRASWNTDRVSKATNELRNQVQVYLENPMEGW